MKYARPGTFNDVAWLLRGTDRSDVVAAAGADPAVTAVTAGSATAAFAAGAGLPRPPRTVTTVTVPGGRVRPATAAAVDLALA